MVNYQSINIDFLPDFASLAKWIKKVIILHDYVPGELLYTFCDDSYLIEINNKFLGHDTYTDIITFPSSTDFHIISGDIFISIPRVRENAKLLNNDFESEFARVLIHGVLHMMGYDDHTDREKEIMRRQEDKSLSLRLQ